MSDHVDGDVAPAVGAVLTTAQAVELATWLLWPGADLAEPPGDMEDLARTILAWAQIVAAAEAQTDAVEAWKDANAKFSRLSVGQGHRPVDEARWATESAVRAYRAAGGGA